MRIVKVDNTNFKAVVSVILAILILLTFSVPESVWMKTTEASQSCIWFCFRGGSKRTGEVHVECGPQSEELNYLWEYSAIAQVKSSAVIAESKVFFGSEDGKMHCLEQSNGNQLWETDVSQDIHSSPAFSMGNIYFGCDDGVMYCLDSENGEIVWTFETEASIHSSPTIYNQRLFFGSYDHSIYCLDLRKGNLLWSYRTDGEIFSSPAVYDDKVFIGSDDRTMYCLDFWKGEFLWSFETNLKIDTTPVFIDERVIFGSDSMYCLSADTGKVFWEFPMGEYGVSSCAVAQNMVIVCRWDGMLYNLGLYSGRYIWSRRIKGFTVAPSICGYRIYLATDEGWFASLDLFDGEVIWEVELNEPIATNPAISDGIVVVGGTEGTVFCYGDELVRDCLSLDVEVIDFGTIPAKSNGQIEVNILNCGLNELPVDYEIVGDWFSVKRFPAGAIPHRQQRHFFVYLLSQSLGLEKVYTGKLIIKWPGYEKILNVRVFVDNEESSDGGCEWLSRQGGFDGSGEKSKGCAPDRDILAEKYNVEFSDIPISQPLVVDDFVIVSRQTGLINCLDESSGRKLWEYACDGITRNTPAICDGKLYFSTIRGVVGCLDIRDGSELWTKKLSSPPKTSLRVWRDKIFFGDYRNYLVALSTDNGDEIESFKPSGRITKIPAVTSAKVFFGTDEGNFYCMSTADLTSPIWERSFGSAVTTSISVNGENCCFGTSLGVVYNIGSRTGSVIWEKRLNSWIDGDIAISKDAVYCTTRSNALYSLSIVDGNINWKTEDWGKIYAGPVVSDDRVFLTADAKLFMLSTFDGLILWSGDFRREIRQFSVSNGKIFACSQNRNLYCITNLPYIQFKPKVINFGSFSQASNRTEKFQITNTTSRDITVQLKTEADWFTISKPKVHLEPGDTVEISLKTIPYKVNAPGIRTGQIDATWEDDLFGLKTWAYVTRGSSSPKEWYGFGGDNKNGRNNSEKRFNTKKLKNLWSYKTNAPIFSSPLLAKGRLFIGSNDSDLRCIDADNGMLLWSFNTGSSIVSTGTLANDEVIFGSEDGYVYCLDDSTGVLKWKFFTGGLVSSVISQKRSNSNIIDVMFGTSKGKFYCITEKTVDHKTKEKRIEINWEKDFGSLIDCSPAIDSGNVYFVTRDGLLLCLKISNGNKLWSKKIGATMSSPVIVDNYLVAETVSDGLFCFDIKNRGKQVWSNKLIYGVSSPINLDESIIACGSNGWVASIDIITGEINWLKDVESPINSSPATDNNTVFVADMGGKITAFDVGSSKEVWSYNLKLPIISSPAIWNGRLYVGVCDSRVYCFGEK